ncbi:hypothetical protein [Actinoplanes teichomyceticus]|uniref:Excreted virulence factor EspC (Type VII ESX diderm) n=1 Tax=Actinoplanes teichomyceticus TaxID=1867 RepID=A0A561WID1_ACTTI|nr:hypothetical protein [Actinoplanes teichomyceticus]TWG23632.1 excreted virulence factor EspC (type VII ESX diderm) [Actinoplanes teichomyceticus]GIF11671.1 hypothetical protein Ate01nite_17030 [Actinoplanes teichomyceticus]
MSFEVEPEVLDTVAAGLSADAQALQAQVAKLQDAAVTSDAYGRIGALVGVNTEYQELLGEATREIAEAAAVLDRASALLRFNAESYRSTDAAHAEQFGKVR